MLGLHVRDEEYYVYTCSGDVSVHILLLYTCYSNWNLNLVTFVTIFISQNFIVKCQLQCHLKCQLETFENNAEVISLI